MNYFLLSSLALSIVIIFSSHPVSVLSIILIQTVLICITIWLMMNSSWTSFILFLIFLGGLMVLFVYIVSLASNEKFEPSIESLTPLMIYLALSALIFLSMDFNWSMNSESSLFSIMKMIFSESIYISILMIMSYLLYTLIVVVKISSMNEGPLRSVIK